MPTSAIGENKTAVEGVGSAHGAMRYRAFISYSHAADGKFAPALQSCLQRFARPWNRPWAIRVFRDQTDLGLNPDLWASVEQALSESEYFILLASPEAAASKWVARELEYWVSNRGRAKLLIVLTSGELTWNDTTGDFDWNTTTALPMRIKGTFHEPPLYLDLKWAKSEEHLSLSHGRFRDSIAEIAATLHGKSKAEMESEGVRQARRALRMAISAVISLTFLAITTGLAAMFAWNRAKIAEERRIQAEKARDEAISQVLVTRSTAYLPQPLDVGILYGIEALHLLDSSATRANLLDLVQTAPTLEGFLPEMPYVRQMAFSPDGTRLATAGRTLVSGVSAGRVALWDLKTRSPLWVRTVDSEVVHLAFTADGNTLLAVHTDPSLRWLNPADGSTIAMKSLTAPGVTPVDGWLSDHGISGDGTMLVAKGKNNVMQWDLHTGALRKIPLPGAGSHFYVDALAVASSDHTTIAMAGLNELWHRQPPDEDWHRIGRLTRPGPVTVNSTGDSIAFADERSVYVWNSKTGKSILVFEMNEEPSSLAWSHDGTKLAVGGKDGTIAVRLPELVAHLPMIKLYGQDSEVVTMTFSQDGQWLASVSRSGRIAMWSLQFPHMVISNKEVIILRPRVGTPLNHTPGETGLALSADGSSAVSKDRTGTIILSNVDDGKPIAFPKSATSADETTSVAVSADGLKIAVTKRGAASLIDTRRDTILGAISGPSSVAFSEDGKRIAITTDRGIQLWNAESMTPAGNPFPIHYIDAVTHQALGDPISVRGAAIAFSRDGKWLAVGAGPDAYLANLAERSAKTRIVVGLQGSEQITSIAMSPDNAVLTTGMQDGSIRLWDAANGAAAGRLRWGHFGPVAALAFDRTGSQLTSLDEGGNIVRWQLDPRYWIEAACRLVNRNLFLDERLPIVGDRPSNHSCPVTRNYVDLLLAQAPNAAR